MYFNQLFVFLSSLAELSAEIEQAGNANKEHREMLTRIIEIYRDYAKLPQAFAADEKRPAELQDVDEVLGFIQTLYDNICKTEVKLSVMICVPDLDTRDALKPLAKAFAADSDCDCAAAVVDELAPYMSSDGIELHSFNKWLEGDICADIVIVPCAYSAEIWSKLSAHSLACVYIPLFEENDSKAVKNAVDAAWRVITSALPDNKPMLNAVCIEDAKSLPCRPAVLPPVHHQLLSENIGDKKWITWQVSSYEDVFSDNILSSIEFLSYILKNTNLNVIWIQPSDISCGKDVLPYMRDIMIAAQQSGRALLLNADEFSFALQNSCAVCSDDKATASLFSKLGYPVLSARSDNGEDKNLRSFIKAVEELPSKASSRENLARKLKETIINEFEKDFLAKA